MFPTPRQGSLVASRLLAAFAVMTVAGCASKATSVTESKLGNGVTLKFAHPYGPGSCEGTTISEGTKDGRMVAIYKEVCSWKGDNPGKVVVLINQDLSLTVDGRAFGVVGPSDEVVINATGDVKVLIKGEERQPGPAGGKGIP